MDLFLSLSLLAFPCVKCRVPIFALYVKLLLQLVFLFLFLSTSPVVASIYVATISNHFLDHYYFQIKRKCSTLVKGSAFHI